MFDVRRIAQGLLVAFTLTLLVPPMPAWASKPQRVKKTSVLCRWSRSVTTWSA